MTSIVSVLVPCAWTWLRMCRPVRYYHSVCSYWSESYAYVSIKSKQKVSIALVLAAAVLAVYISEAGYPLYQYNHGGDY